MNHVKKFTRLVKEGVDKYGILFPSSRISNTRLKLYNKLENILSENNGKEDTVSFSSGLLAGKTIADILSSYKNILIAPNTHPAIYIENAEKLHSATFIQWKNDVVNFINNSLENEFVLLSDSVDVLKAEVNNFSFVEEIHKSKKIIYLIDDSHGIGILGKKGEGISSELINKSNIEFIISYSLSKAFNIEGGAVSCSKFWSEKVRNHHNYTGSTAINPALIHAFLKSKKLYVLQREKLFKNIKYLKKNLPSYLLNHNYNLPIFICKEENAADVLHKNGIIISSFGYPHPSSKKINRIVINAQHTKKDLQKLCKIS
jgi:7-keto-8-aminopelargonate synthetase-like enzyme